MEFPGRKVPTYWHFTNFEEGSKEKEIFFEADMKIRELAAACLSARNFYEDFKDAVYGTGYDNPAMAKSMIAELAVRMQDFKAPEDVKVYVDWGVDPADPVKARAKTYWKKFGYWLTQAYIYRESVKAWLGGLDAPAKIWVKGGVTTANWCFVQMIDALDDALDTLQSAASFYSLYLKRKKENEDAGN